MLKEFKDFINKGNVVTIAVGLVMALYFQKIVDAVLDGVINPLIAAIFGESNFTEIGFDMRRRDGSRASGWSSTRSSASSRSRSSCSW